MPSPAPLTELLSALLLATLASCGTAPGDAGNGVPAEQTTGTVTSTVAAPPGAAGPTGEPAGGTAALTRRDPNSPLPVPQPATLATEGLLNGGFEWIADGTTEPPKYGAYWRGAFVYRPDDPGDLIIDGEAPGELPAAEGRRFLRLTPDDQPVKQKLVADPRWTDQIAVTLSLRSLAGAALDVTLEDGPGLRSTVSLPAPKGVSWQTHQLALGELFRAEHGHPPTPRLNLWLSCRDASPHKGAPPPSVDVDKVSVSITMPALGPEVLAEQIIAQARRVLHEWFDPQQAGGLGIVDPATGYNLFRAFDVETGADRVASTQVGLHSIHSVLLAWLEIAHTEGWNDEISTWTPNLQRIVRTLVEHHFDEDTGLPRLINLASGEPADDTVVTVGSYVEFLARALPLLDDEGLAEAARARVRGTADTLLRLALQHDLPQNVFNTVQLDRKTGIFEGQFPNWFGRMPNRLTPQGVIDVPRQFNTAWAIVSGRSFWYHMFKSPAAIMWAHALQPRHQDLNGVRRALEQFHRDWDAARYDLENDTDDHYGYLMEDLLDVYRHGGSDVPRALELITTATDHRAAHTASEPGQTLWIQAVRLGTACAGDSPRALKGLHDLYRLPGSSGAAGAGLPLYRDVLQELAANDYKGRQLTNGQFTESFFRHWEMVCICYKGTYQGDCRERPLDQWDGDVGDIFGGPPMQGIEAQVWAYSVATATERQLILARLGTLRYVTESTLARPYGYLFGMPREVAEQYQLPPKYVTGLSRRSTIGLGYLMSWLHLLPLLLQP